MVVLVRGALDGIRISSHHGEAKIPDTCTAELVHKDIRLAMYQYNCGTRSRKITYSLEVPMDYIARMKVAEAISDVG